MWSNSWVNRCWPFKGSSRVKGKLSCTVPRGVGHRNVARLLDFPQSEMMQRLDSLALDQESLKKVKTKLLLHIKNEEQKSRSDPQAIQSYANRIVDKLIPVNKLDPKQYKVTGLKQIYYNYPHNLWPISGPANRSKGKKDSIKFSIAHIFFRTNALLGNNYVALVAKRAAKKFKVSLDCIKTKTKEDREQTAELLSTAIFKNFVTESTNSGVDLDWSILPYIKKKDEIISMLAFFKSTPIGIMSKRFSREIAIEAKGSFSIARKIALHMMYEQFANDPECANKMHSVTKAAKKITKIFYQSLKSEILASLDLNTVGNFERERSDSSLGSDVSSLKEKEEREVISKIPNTMLVKIKELTKKESPQKESKLRKHKLELGKDLNSQPLKMARL